MRGSIRQRGPDRWQVRVLVGRNPENGRTRYVSREVRGGKRAAERAAAQLVAEVERGGHEAQAGRHTVAELLDRWLTHIEGQGRAMSTLVRYRSAMKANIKPRLGSFAIAKLGPADVDRFYTELAKRGLSLLTIPKSHAFLSAAFNQALKWGWLDRNPVDRASPPGLRGREINPPTPARLASLLEACDANPDLCGSTARTFKRQLAYGGAGELSSLRAWLIWVRV